jgi:hypothetical protein
LPNETLEFGIWSLGSDFPDADLPALCRPSNKAYEFMLAYAAQGLGDAGSQIGGQRELLSPSGAGGLSAQHAALESDVAGRVTLHAHLGARARCRRLPPRSNWCSRSAHQLSWSIT